jgi:hypothetical protein
MVPSGFRMAKIPIRYLTCSVQIGSSVMMDIL